MAVIPQKLINDLMQVSREVSPSLTQRTFTDDEAAALAKAISEYVHGQVIHMAELIRDELQKVEKQG